MNDPDKQKLIDDAVHSLRKVGFETVSLVATSEGKTYTQMSFEMRPKKSALGRGLSEIVKEPALQKLP